jgi:hypothetical protein
MRAVSGLGRREFMKLVGLAAGVGVPSRVFAATRGTVALVPDMHDGEVASAPVAWSLGRLSAALAEKGVLVRTGAAKADHVVSIARKLQAGREDVWIGPGKQPSETLVRSGGARGLAYGLNELAERVTASTDPIAALAASVPTDEKPASRVRSVLRAFSSDIEDKPWFYDKEGWTGYLDLLAASRFNRLQLAFGFAYDFPKGVTEDYFHFVYPYLVAVPGYDVRVEPLDPGERERNLEMLQFITHEAGLRAIDFQLGIWTHAYQWTDSPEAHHHVTGLTPANHAPYCRDALALLLKLCPDITGVSMRIHGESGIPEGSYGFWRTVFEACAQCGRPFEIDMHAKGIDQTIIDLAVATGKAVKVSPKYSAEHQALGYHQADIRALEYPRPGHMDEGDFRVSNGARRFTRYGYADLYQEGRKYDILYRRWPGTQRHTLNGDPAQAAAYGRSAHFCNAAGLEICEPLTFKGRNGSGMAGGRLAYLDKTLDTGARDWLKFVYSYRLWGRTLYNPDADPQTWRRPLQSRFGAAALPLERAMGEASRILLIFTSTHLPTAANRGSWYETYTNMPIVPGVNPMPYHDTPEPYCAATVSPLDPQLFSSAVDHADALLNKSLPPRYSPVEVAAWMQACADAAATALAEARAKAPDRHDPEFRRWEEDIAIQIGLGRFFAGKFRATVLYQLFQRTKDAGAGEAAIACYQEARDAWAAMAERAKTVYVPDISYGMPEYERGHWMARLPAIDSDLKAMREAIAAQPDAKPSSDPAIRAAVASATTTTPRWSAACGHTPSDSFHPGAELQISLEAAAPVEAVELWYRHVDQAERWQHMPMQRTDTGFRASIPAGYTGSPYPLQYYFVLRSPSPQPVFFPAFNATLSNQPYFAVWKRS